MDLRRYQNQAKRFAIYPQRDLITSVMYCALELANEAGEVAGKIKKIFRDDDGIITEEHKEALKKELGDVLWPLAQLCTELEIDLGIVAMMNISKLRKRLNDNVLHGSGDDR